MTRQGWKPDNLKEYVDVQVLALQRERDAISRLDKEARDKALDSLEKRLDGMNEFRLQLANQASMFLTHQEYDAKHDLLVKDVDILRDELSAIKGRVAGSSSTVTTFITIGAIAVTIIIAVVTILVTR